MISAGAIVRIKRHDDIAWVVQGRTLDGRWRCVAKAIDGSNRSAFSSVTAGVGDIVVQKEAPVFEPGATARYENVDHTVIEDRGDTVVLSVPSSRFDLRGKGALHIPSGNTAVVKKSDVVLEALA